MRIHTFALCVCVYTLISCVCAKKNEKKDVLIDPMEHDIFIVTEKTFDTVISQFLGSTVASVLYYKESSDKPMKALIDNVYNKLAGELKGMAKVAAVDCDAHTAFCEKQGVEVYPQIMLYPLLPMPKKTFMGQYSVPKLKHAILSMIDTPHIKHINKTNMDIVLSEDPGVPKAVLISEKDAPATMYKALANAFHDRVTFAFAPKSEESVVARFKPTKFPHLEIRTGDNKSHKFEGAFEYPKMHEWINVHSETFVRGGGFSDDVKHEDAKPWLIQPIPEMTADSHYDICVKKEGWCAIYVSDSTELSEDKIEMLLRVKEAVKKISHTSKFNWMWLDVITNADMKDVFQITETPTIVILNPHKKLRFSRPEPNDISEEGLEKFLEKIISGDGKFTIIKGGKLPQFKKKSIPSDQKEEL